MPNKDELIKLLENDQALKVKLMDLTSEGIIVHDLEGNYLYVNDAGCAMRGYSREELMQKNVRDLAAPGYEEVVKKHLAELINTGKTELEVAQVRKDGTMVYLDIHSSVVDLGQTKVVMGVARDITERKRIESDLKDSEARFRNLTTHSPVGIFMTDINGQVQYINSRLSELSGQTPLEASGLGWLNAIHPDDKERVKAQWEKAFQVYQEYQIDFRFRKHDGTIIWVHLATVPFKDENEAVIGYIGNCIDITELTTAGDKLFKAQEELQTIFDSSPALVFYKDKNNVLIRANKAFCDVLQRAKTEIEGKTAFELFPDNAEKYWVDDMQVMNTGIPMLNIIEQMETKNGLHWVRTDKIPYFDEKGNVTGIIGFSLDITEQKLAEESLRRSENNYRLLADNATDVIWTVDMNNKLTYISPSVTRLLGFTVEEAINRPMQEAFTPETFDRAMKLFAEEIARENGPEKDPHRARITELEMTRKNGPPVWVEGNFSFLRDGTGRPTGILTIVRDIAERKQAEKELKESNASLKKALEGTVDALSMATEIRDPYTAGHQKRVADLAYAMAAEMGLSVEDTYWLKYAGLIHDIGKISIPLEILNKPGRLTDVEFTMIKMHSQIGYEIVKTIAFPKPVAEIILQHHERINGTGYPRGLGRDKMLVESLIISVADVVEAMASDRPYRPALGIDKALEEITNNKGVLYDSQAVDVCVKLFREKGFQFTKY